MLKYIDVKETFAEVPDEINLCISISGCTIHCKGCHSQHLWENTGTELTPKELHRILEEHKGITCVCILGGEHDITALKNLFRLIRNFTQYKTCWYSGLNSISLNDSVQILPFLDYVKYGPYIEERGPLTSRTTNQKFLKRISDGLEDITYRFWNDKTDS